ncbi:MAG: bifunctional phosphoribosyl-AMP cyclohydrolase/phosphoribosyl-ATP diphosphatase HisIE [Cytophagaceae bacterium]|nr:bifunctional phosphoribosyl-AMP cyclohydrolase/phosphoribosyl-ATP diphosphatase HisIE [Cytophagaceae bacterium]MDW8456987.1 bifunctional phosphoribosyl-AMP cyclohydrolase/phosphoribosyl-ATP diphosphatase HisIE [Cytophagaceae bacterium]
MSISFPFSSELIPAIIQDASTRRVLMLGYMNMEAYEKTVREKRVTFFSRSKNRLWTKGETSGNFLNVVEILMDCDNDTLLIKVNPVGPVCHTGSDTCWNEQNSADILFIEHLKHIIKLRHVQPSEKSYTSTLLAKGINKVAQKLGEEAIELIIEAKDNNKELFLNEAADLLFHYLVLLEKKDIDLNEVIQVLKKRNK